jgi:hypothetical protein
MMFHRHKRGLMNRIFKEISIIMNHILIQLKSPLAKKGLNNPEKLKP